METKFNMPNRLLNLLEQILHEFSLEPNILFDKFQNGSASAVSLDELAEDYCNWFSALDQEDVSIKLFTMLQDIYLFINKNSGSDAVFWSENSYKNNKDWISFRKCTNSCLIQIREDISGLP